MEYAKANPNSNFKHSHKSLSLSLSLSQTHTHTKISHTHTKISHTHRNEREREREGESENMTLLSEFFVVVGLVYFGSGRVTQNFKTPTRNSTRLYRVDYFLTRTRTDYLLNPPEPHRVRPGRFFFCSPERLIVNIFCTE